jgi:hypothetical protein
MAGERQYVPLHVCNNEQDHPGHDDVVHLLPYQGNIQSWDTGDHPPHTKHAQCRISTFQSTVARGCEMRISNAYVCREKDPGMALREARTPSNRSNSSTLNLHPNHGLGNCSHMFAHGRLPRPKLRDGLEGWLVDWLGHR